MATTEVSQSQIVCLLRRESQLQVKCKRQLQSGLSLLLHLLLLLYFALDLPRHSAASTAASPSCCCCDGCGSALNTPITLVHSYSAPAPFTVDTCAAPNAPVRGTGRKDDTTVLS